MTGVSTEHGDRVFLEGVRDLAPVERGPRAGGIPGATEQASKIDPDDDRISRLNLSFDTGGGPPGARLIPSAPPWRRRRRWADSRRRTRPRRRNLRSG